MTDTMQAIVMQRFGGPEVLEIGTVARPHYSDSQLLVKVHATALNRADTLQRKGKYPPPPGASEILGLEMAGEVIATGKDCSKYKIGDRVFALLSGGGYAQYVAIEEGMALPIPHNLDYEKAAGIAEVFLTAFQALDWLAKTQADDFVLIHAGASGVGTAAIQLAKAMGAKPIATASSQAKLDYCISLGAIAGINYKEQNFAEEVMKLTKGHGADVIIDFVAASYLDKNLSCIAQDGRWVLLALLGGIKAELNMAQILRKRVTLMGSTLRSRTLDYKVSLSRELTNKFLAAFESGQIKPIIDRVYPWQEVDKAHTYMEQNRNIGKIILKVLH